MAEKPVIPDSELNFKESNGQENLNYLALQRIQKKRLSEEEDEEVTLYEKKSYTLNEILKEEHSSKYNERAELLWKPKIADIVWCVTPGSNNYGKVSIILSKECLYDSKHQYYLAFLNETGHCITDESWLTPFDKDALQMPLFQKSKPKPYVEQQRQAIQIAFDFLDGKVSEDTLGHPFEQCSMCRMAASHKFWRSMNMGNMEFLSEIEKISQGNNLEKQQNLIDDYIRQRLKTWNLWNDVKGMNSEGRFYYYESRSSSDSVNSYEEILSKPRDSDKVSVADQIAVEINTKAVHEKQRNIRKRTKRRPMRHLPKKRKVLANNLSKKNEIQKGKSNTEPVESSVDSKAKISHRRSLRRKNSPEKSIKDEKLKETMENLTSNSTVSLTKETEYPTFNQPERTDKVQQETHHDGDITSNLDGIKELIQNKFTSENEMKPSDNVLNTESES